jgi:diguanylate cyclase (GGDEF)-like protein
VTQILSSVGAYRSAAGSAGADASPALEAPSEHAQALLAALASAISDHPVGTEWAREVQAGVAVVDGRFTIISANARLGQLVGVEREALVGASVTSGPLAAEMPGLSAVVQAAFTGRASRTIVAATGARAAGIWLELAAAPVAAGSDRQAAIVVALDETETRRASAQVTGLCAIAAAIGRSADTETAVTLSLTACRHALLADAAVLYAISPEGLTVQGAAADGMSPASLERVRQQRWVVGMGPVGEVAATGRSLGIREIGNEDAVVAELARRERLLSAAMAAVRAPSGQLGVLAVFSRRPRTHDATDLCFLEAAGCQIGLLLRNERLAAELGRQARADPLTGLINRPFFVDLAAREYQRSLRLRAPATLLLADLNGTKQINERYGHAVGDQVILAVAGGLQSAIRGADLASRLGGDEFAVLLPDCGESEAADVVGRWRERTSGRKVVVPDGAVSAQFSVGTAVTTFAPGESVDTLLARAEADMYRAKAAGGKPAAR